MEPGRPDAPTGSVVGTPLIFAVLGAVFTAAAIFALGLTQKTARKSDCGNVFRYPVLNTPIKTLRIVSKTILVRKTDFPLFSRLRTKSPFSDLL